VIFLKNNFYSVWIFAPMRFISSTKFGYDTLTDSGSVTVQPPTYIPAMQKAMNNLWSSSEFKSAPDIFSDGSKINPSSFS
jgi:hypothetical protein